MLALLTQMALFTHSLGPFYIASPTYSLGPFYIASPIDTVAELTMHNICPTYMFGLIYTIWPYLHIMLALFTHNVGPIFYMPWPYLYNSAPFTHNVGSFYTVGPIHTNVRPIYTHFNTIFTHNVGPVSVLTHSWPCSHTVTVSPRDTQCWPCFNTQLAMFTHSYCQPSWHTMLALF